MKHVLALLFGLFITSAQAANVNIDALPAAASVGGTDLLECEQAGTNRKCTAAQTAAYVYGLMSADATAAAGGAITLATVNGNVGTFGSATACITTTQNAKGLTTAISAATCTPAIGSITGLGTGVQTALAAAMNSSTGPVGALTPTNNNCIVGNGSAWTSTTCPGGGGTPGGSTTQVQYNNAGAFGGIAGATTNGTALTLVAPVLGTPASGTLTNTTGFPLANLAGAGTGVLSAGAAALNASTGLIGALTPTNGNCVTGNGSAWTSASCATGTASAVPNVQSGTNYAFQGTDLTKIIYLSNASPQVPTIAQAGTGSFTNGWYTTACNIGAGTQTITPTTSTIAGASTYVLPAGSAAAPKCIGLASDGTNYVIVPDYFRWGANVETAAGNALSSAGGLTTTVVSGTSALGTGAITSQTCATVVTTTATGTATTDVIQWGFNGDPTGSTGYLPTAMLTVVAYPSSGNVNFKVCNLTGSSITPAAQTLNWRVAR